MNKYLGLFIIFFLSAAIYAAANLFITGDITLGILH